MSLAGTIRTVIADAMDASPAEPMNCPYCGAKADRVGGPFYYWKCPEGGAFGTTWEWEQEHKWLARAGKTKWRAAK